MEKRRVSMSLFQYKVQISNVKYHCLSTEQALTWEVLKVKPAQPVRWSEMVRVTLSEKPNQMTAAGISEGTPGNRLDVTHVAFHSLCYQVSRQDDS